MRYQATRHIILKRKCVPSNKYPPVCISMHLHSREAIIIDNNNPYFYTLATFGVKAWRAIQSQASKLNKTADATGSKYYKYLKINYLGFMIGAIFALMC